MIIFTLLARCFLLGLHMVYSFYLQLKFIRALLNKVRYKLMSMLQDRQSVHSAETRMIGNCVKQFPKVPKHIMVSLGEEAASYADLAQIIVWSFPAGITIVSFYDYKNEVNAAELYRVMSELYPEWLAKIKWGVSFDKDVCNGTSAENGIGEVESIQVNVLCSKHGRQMLVDAVFDLCSMKAILDDRKATELALDKLILSKMDSSPDPDLMIVCGNLYTTYGFSPWNVSFTEFALVPSYKLLTASDFVGILALYANCAQNWGT